MKIPELQHSREEQAPSKYLLILKSALQHSLSELRETEYLCYLAEAVFKRWKEHCPGCLTGCNSVNKWHVWLQ